MKTKGGHRWTNDRNVMEAMFGHISMQVELEVVPKKQLIALEEAQQRKYILPPMRMEIQSILKSLGVTPQRKNSTYNHRKNSPELQSYALHRLFNSLA